MAHPQHQRKPTFFWQGVLILLPVAALALCGLFSLRQDRLLAEQEAKQLGTSLAERLAQAAGGETSHGLLEYRNANFDLQANRSTDLTLASWSGGSKAENVAWQQIKTWQEANPGIDLFAMPLCDCSVSLHDEPWGPSQPRTYTSVPQPPMWLQQLTPEQDQLWQYARECRFNAAAFPKEQALVEKFIAANPPAGARATAEYLLLLAKTRGMAAAEAATQYAGSPWNKSAQLTDAGLSVGQLICYQALRLMPDGAGVSDKLLHTLAWTIWYNPSIFSPRVIAEAERVGGKGSSESESGTAALKGWWNSEERTRKILADFRAQHPAATWTNRLFWVDSGKDVYLLVMDTENHVSMTAVPPESGTLTAAYHRLMLFPQAVVNQALNDALNKANIEVPQYAAVQLEIGENNLNCVQGNILRATNAPSRLLLGEANGHFSDLPVEMGVILPFRVRVLLADPGTLYARQRQRTLLFGAVIVLSAIAAAIGFVAARGAFRRQQQLSEMKSNFVSSVSHELRAPIASVRLMAENLEHGKVPEPAGQNAYFHFIAQECQRLSSLIENILDFSRIEEGRKQYEIEPVDLTALTRQTVRLMETRAADRGVRLESVLPEKIVSVDADGKALQQALVNLVDNAIKHSPKGAAVRIGLESDADSLRLWVEDRGEGIPPEEQAIIFERFYRRGSELRRETQGVGIGLSIVKHIVEAHGGTIRVRSAVGQGSRFTIELAVKTAEDAA
jgi:signal transduction histidine kinase